MSRRQTFMRMYGLILVYGLALVLCVFAVSGCASLWAKTKAHAAEVGLAGVGGALATGPAGPIAFVGLAAAGVAVNEMIQPPPDVILVTHNKDGTTTSTRTHTKESDMPAPGIWDIITARILDWIGYIIVVGVVCLLLRWQVTRNMLKTAFRAGMAKFKATPKA